MKKLALELKEINFSLEGHKILHNINLSIEEGEFIVIVGPNGSGKSTLLKIINGLVKPDFGKVIIDGFDQTKLAVNKIALFVSTLTQDLNNSTFSELSVLNNMQISLQRKTISKPRIANKKESIANYLSDFNPSLKVRLFIPSMHLSGGQRQALALAMSLIHTPYLLLLDEHTSALDHKAASNLMEITNNHVTKNKLTTIMVTHNLDHALKYGTRLMVFSNGQIIKDWPKNNKAPLNKNELIDILYEA